MSRLLGRPFALAVPVATIVTVGALAACGDATSNSATPSAAPTSSATASARSTAGMVMPEAGATAAAEGRPTATAAMVCGGEIKGKVQQVLKLKALPKTSSTFAGSIFTCTYNLPVGLMRLSVQHSPNKATALVYLQTKRVAVHAQESVPGLGERAYATGTGAVLVIKDNETLEVDTTGLPLVFGDEGQKRTDLAYEIASDVLGCWTGEEDS